MVPSIHKASQLYSFQPAVSPILQQRLKAPAVIRLPHPLLHALDSARQDPIQQLVVPRDDSLVPGARLLDTPPRREVVPI